MRHRRLGMLVLCALAATLDPGLTTSTAWQQIAEVRDTLIAIQRDSTAPVGWNEYRSAEEFHDDLTYELRGRGWALVTVEIIRRQGRPVPPADGS